MFQINLIFIVLVVIILFTYTIATVTQVYAQNGRLCIARVIKWLDNEGVFLTNALIEGIYPSVQTSTMLKYIV